MKKEIRFVCNNTIRDLAIAEIKFPSGRIEYAVVTGVDYRFNVWDYSLGYYDSYEEAEKRYIEKMIGDVE